MDVQCKWTSWYIADRWWDVKSLDLLAWFSTCSSNQPNFPSSISCIAIFSLISTPKLQTCLESNICLESQLECYLSYLSKPSNLVAMAFFCAFLLLCFLGGNFVLVLMKLSKSLPRTGSIPAAIASRVPSEEQWLLWGLLWSNPAVNHVSQLHRSAPCDLNTSFDVRVWNVVYTVYYIRFLHTFVRCKASITHGIF